MGPLRTLRRQLRIVVLLTLHVHLLAQGVFGRLADRHGCVRSDLVRLQETLCLWRQSGSHVWTHNELLFLRLLQGRHVSVDGATNNGALFGFAELHLRRP